MANIPTTLNNPGDIKDPKTGNFKKFKNPQEGFLNLKNDLKAKITGNTSTGLTGKSTLREFANKWAPPSDNNDSEGYAKNLAKKLKITPDTPIGSLQNRLDEFAGAVADNEGYKGPRVLGATESISPMPEESTGSHEMIKQNVLKLQNAGASPDDIELYVKKAVEEGGTTKGTPKKPTLDDVIKQQKDNPSTSTVIDTTSPGNVIEDVKKGNLGEAIQSGIRNVGNFLTGGGSEQLGKYLGTKNAQIHGGENAKYVDPEGGSTKDLMEGGLKTALGIGGVISGGEALQGVKGLLGAKTALSSSLLEDALPITLKKFAAKSAAGKLDVLRQALKYATQNPNGSQQEMLINKAIQEITPLANKELGLGPGLLQKVGTLSKGLIKKGGRAVVGASGLGGGALAAYDHFTKK